MTGGGSPDPSISRRPGIRQEGDQVSTLSNDRARMTAVGVNMRGTNIGSVFVAIVRAQRSRDTCLPDTVWSWGSKSSPDYGPKSLRLTRIQNQLLRTHQFWIKTSICSTCMIKNNLWLKIPSLTTSPPSTPPEWGRITGPRI